MIRGILTSYSYHIYRFIKPLSKIKRRSWCEENDIVMKTSRPHFYMDLNISQCSHVYLIIYRFTIFNIIQKYITGDKILTIVINIFNVNISNGCIICICFNPTYILPNVFRTILQCDRTIGPTLRYYYYKWPVIWSFIFVYRIISEHDFIS